MPRKYFYANSLQEAQAKLDREDVCGVHRVGDIKEFAYDLREEPPDAAGLMYSYACKITLRPQAESVDDTTDLVLLTLGGNDARFETIISTCFSPYIQFIHEGANGPKCKAAIETAENALPNIMDDLEEKLDKLLSERMAGNPNSQVVLSSYPLLSLERDYGLKLDSGEFYPSVREVRRLGELAVTYQRDMVQRLERRYPGRVKLIDSTPSAFAGHEPHPLWGFVNGDRWINQFVETEGDYADDGTVHAKNILEKEHFWHPNIAGHREWSKLIEASGVTPSAPLIGDRDAALDVVFVLDATASMAKNWKLTVQSIKSTMTRFEETDVRFALVTYQDHPDGGGEPGNYPARVEQGFTSDADTMYRALDGVQLASAGDPAESVYSGIMTGLTLDGWRPGASKTVLVIGDGAAKDPEPVTGYTWNQIRGQALASTTARISVLDNDALTAVGLPELAVGTGGSIIPQADPATPSDTMADEIKETTARPFAWLQGPYVDRVGSTVQFDARASFARGGSHLVKFEWDFDGDGTYDRVSASPETLYRYDNEIVGFAQVRVTDAVGRTAVAAADLAMTRDGDVFPDEFDNCPDVANPLQQDANQNRIGDACEPLENFEIRPPALIEPPTPSPSPSASASPSPTTSPTPSPEPSLTPSASPSPDPSASPSMSPSEQPSASPSPQPSASPSPSAAPSPTGLPPRPTGPAPTSSPTAPRPSSPAASDPTPGRPGLPKTGATT
ncbi:MAG: VWA domain-containing protein [Propionibacteriaceae bacterium]|nr:VWA domain-containing protein [Propionibacteriaceae bacterium]